MLFEKRVSERPKRVVKEVIYTIRDGASKELDCEIFSNHFYSKLCEKTNPVGPFSLYQICRAIEHAKSEIRASSKNSKQNADDTVTPSKKVLIVNMNFVYFPNFVHLFMF